MYSRFLKEKLQKVALEYPVVTITGPRQSGKTTLCQMSFPDKPYVSLEDFQTRTMAQTDPKAFLAQYPNGAIFDEIQRVPNLTSSIQGVVDQKKQNGFYILTGSQNFQLVNSISQSLAGRTALLTLLPLSFAEMSTAENTQLNICLRRGFYPRVCAQNLEPGMFYRSYNQTYVERDIRLIENIKNLDAFQKFIVLCAGRVGQLLNLSNMSNELGVSSVTLKHWLTLLQASYLVYLLKPYSKKINKRLTKMPKLYFYDVGLACSLLGIEKEEHLSSHPLRGNLFENMVVIDFLKNRCNEGLSDNLYFFRDHQGNEVDLVMEEGHQLKTFEIKSSSTFAPDFFKGLQYFDKLVGEKNILKRTVIYGGEEKQKWSYASLMPYYF